MNLFEGMCKKPLNAFLSAAGSKKPSLVKRLSAQVQNLKASAEKVGKKLKADSVSIEVGWLEIADPSRKGRKYRLAEEYRVLLL